MRLPRLMLAFFLVAAVAAAYPQTTAKTAGNGKAQKFPGDHVVSGCGAVL